MLSWSSAWQQEKGCSITNCGFRETGVVIYDDTSLGALWGTTHSTFVASEYRCGDNSAVKTNRCFMNSLINATTLTLPVLKYPWPQVSDRSVENVGMSNQWEDTTGSYLYICVYICTLLVHMHNFSDFSIIFPRIILNILPYFTKFFMKLNYY